VFLHHDAGRPWNFWFDPWISVSSVALNADHALQTFVKDTVIWCEDRGAALDRAFCMVANVLYSSGSLQVKLLMFVSAISALLDGLRTALASHVTFQGVTAVSNFVDGYGVVRWEVALIHIEYAKAFDCLRRARMAVSDVSFSRMVETLPRRRFP
jgi:hypothetical protein